MSAEDAKNQIVDGLEKWLRDQYRHMVEEQAFAEESRVETQGTLNVQMKRGVYKISSDCAKRKAPRVLQAAVLLANEPRDLSGPQRKEAVAAALRELERKANGQHALWTKAIDVIDAVDVIVDVAKHRGGLEALRPSRGCLRALLSRRR